MVTTIHDDAGAQLAVLSDRAPWIDPRRYGAIPGGTVDCTTAFQTALDVVGPHTVDARGGPWLITGHLLVTQHGVSIFDDGSGERTFLYNPTTAGACITFDLPAATVIQSNRVTGVRFDTTDTTLQKIAIDIVDASNIIIEDVQISTSGSWIGGANVGSFAGTGSIGIRVRGREFIKIRDVTSCGAIPIYIGVNPNNSSLSLDHSELSDLYLIPNGNNPSIYLEDGVVYTNTEFDDIAFVGGSDGVHNVDTTSAVNSYNIIFRNCREEQQPVSGYVIRISHVGGAGVNDLSIEHVVVGGDNCKGVYLRGIAHVTFYHFAYTGLNEALNIDASGPVEWINSKCRAGSTVSLGGLVETWAEGLTDLLSPMPTSARYENTSSFFEAGLMHRAHGVLQWPKTGTLADAATATIPSILGSIVTGTILISFKGATKNGGFLVAINSARAVEIATSDSTLTGVGSTAGKITVDWTTAASIALRNRLGESVTYTWNYALV